MSMKSFLSQGSLDQRMVCLSYFDGPVKGILIDETSSSIFYMSMIDSREDNLGEIRIYSLSLIELFDFDLFVDLCPKIRPVKWPIWVPLWDDENPLQSTIGSSIWDLVSRATPSKVIAWEIYKRVLFAEKELAQHEFEKVNDWFDFLDLR